MINNQTKKVSVFEIILKLWSQITKKRKRQVIVILIIMLLSSVAEIFSLVSAVPFLTVLTDPQLLFEQNTIRNILNSLGIYDSKNLILPICVAFGSLAILATLTRTFNTWISAKVSAAIGSDLSFRCFNKFLYLPYEKQIKQNSSNILSILITEIPITILMLNTILDGIASLIIMSSIILGLFYINPLITFLSIVTLSFGYLLFALLSKDKLKSNSLAKKLNYKSQIQIIQETFGGIRNIILHNSYKFNQKEYLKADYQIRRADALSIFITSIPRYAIECLCLIFLSIVAYFSLTKLGGKFEFSIAILGTFALGSQRLLPSMQQLYRSWSNVKANYASILNVINTLDLKVESPPSFIPKSKSFNSNISLNTVSYKYEKSSPLILNQVNLKIRSGERIGIIGNTGSGKSTILDLITGLLVPSSGEILINGVNIHEKDNEIYLRNWMKSIAIVPQKLFLLDKSIKENIAFGETPENIDLKRIKIAAKIAQISEFIKNYPSGYETMVGERGIKLSGGQIQRIAIARAIYRKAKVLILDEATSALDSKTEKNVINSIQRSDPSITIIMVAHRLTTLTSCDKILEVKEGKIIVKSSLDEE